MVPLIFAQHSLTNVMSWFESLLQILHGILCSMSYVNPMDIVLLLFIQSQSKISLATMCNNMFRTAKTDSTISCI